MLFNDFLEISKSPDDFEIWPRHEGGWEEEKSRERIEIILKLKKIENDISRRTFKTVLSSVVPETFPA